MPQKQLRLNILVLILIAIGFYAPNHSCAQSNNIKNDQFWITTNGTPINSQGGGIFQFKDPNTGQLKYYWYGVHYKEADAYRNDPSTTYSKCSFASVTCYSSTDLVHWTFEADVLTPEELQKKDGGKTSWVGRLGVAYIKESNCYALFVQHDNGLLVAVSATPTGNFTWHQKINMMPYIGTPNTGDQTVFTDEATGKSYLIYSFGRGRNRIYVSELGVKNDMIGLLDCTEVYKGEGREGNCMFKYKGKYYMCASNLYGWDGSFAYYLVADNIRGPYTPINNMQVIPGCEADYAHVSQTGFFYTIKGTTQETVVYCGDRWADFAGNGLGYNQWVPLSFNKDQPIFNSIGSWNLNAHTGTWETAVDNNYVKNGSFEADRKLIPSSFKPMQQQLLGWASTVIEGNAISNDTATSPVLNHLNTNSERKIVIGEKSLLLQDKVPFKRKVAQVIESTPFVPLQDGIYSLSAKAKAGEGFSSLNMYATSAEKTFETAITATNDQWINIQIKEVKIKNGKVEIGFYAAGAANANCLIDDVVLIKK
jgi:hypothetical protein